MKCSNCGAENDPINRFCDQCGARLAPAGAPAAPRVPQSSGAAPACPNCGSPVVPGEAFCDECGADLSRIQPLPAAGEAPTMAAPPSPAAVSGSTLLCPACGHQNLPGDMFCDNCGASLASPAAQPPAAEAPTVFDSQWRSAMNGDNETTTAPEQAQPEVAPAADAQPPPSAEPAVEQAAAEQTTVEPGQEAPPAAEPAEAPPAAPAPHHAQAEQAYLERKAELEGEVARQEQIIGQFEQMLATFGAATPAAVHQGLAEAREALARAEADLAALQPPSPPVDPAEVARLEGEVARQEQIIGQFEQMLATFGAATPAAVHQGLAEAREALDLRRGELAALTGGAAPASVPADLATTLEDVPAVPSEAETIEAPPAAAPDTAAVEEVPSAPAPADAPAGEPAPWAAPAPAAPAAPPPSTIAGPRLVLEESGVELALPPDKSEITIGREDPISGIFPEIDLTPHGGESGGVSRQHARMSLSNGQWTIVDLNSTNFTRLDGTRLDPHVPASVRDGARIQFGRVAVTFHR